MVVVVWIGLLLGFVAFVGWFFASGGGGGGGCFVIGAMLNTKIK